MNMLDLIVAGISLLLGGVTLLAALACAYLLLLTLLSQAPKRHPPGGLALRFALVVPAHDEAAGIARTVRSLQALAWPESQKRIVVVADNCSDDTAERAAAAGATILVRTDPARRGKGYALAHAFELVVEQGWADAVVVIDADSQADSTLLQAMAAALAAGNQAIQTHYAVLNPETSWRTRLMSIAMSAFHVVRSRARENLHWSCGIRGNGWCVSRRLLQEHPYQAWSVVEDVEYGAHLCLAGYRVAYLDQPCVRAEMVSQAAHAAPQRRRWEQGRAQLVRTLVPQLLRTSMHSDDGMCLDLAIDLLVPPLAQLVLAVLVLAAAAAALHLPMLLAVNVFNLAALAAYVMRGWQLSGLGLRCALDLLRAPYFIFWKLAVLARNAGGGWTRTQREHP